jgi:hypothetical protein
MNGTTELGEDDKNQDIGPSARRYDINVTEPPKYIINNPDPSKSGTVIDAGTPKVDVTSRAPMDQGPSLPDPTTTQIIGKPTEVGWGHKRGWVYYDDGWYFFE